MYVTMESVKSDTYSHWFVLLSDAFSWRLKCGKRSNCTWEHRRGLPIMRLILHHSTRVNFRVRRCGKDSFRQIMKSLSPSKRGLQHYIVLTLHSIKPNIFRIAPVWRAHIHAWRSTKNISTLYSTKKYHSISFCSHHYFVFLNNLPSHSWF